MSRKTQKLFTDQKPSPPKPQEPQQKRDTGKPPSPTEAAYLKGYQQGLKDREAVTTPTGDFRFCLKRILLGFLLGIITGWLLNWAY